jgi:hypothetical protein
MKTTNDIKQAIINEIIENCVIGGEMDYSILPTLPLAALELILDGAKKYIFDRKQE